MSASLPFAPIVASIAGFVACFIPHRAPRAAGIELRIGAFMPQARDNVPRAQRMVSMIAVLGARTGRTGSIIALLGGESSGLAWLAGVGDGRIMGVHPMFRDGPLGISERGKLLLHHRDLEMVVGHWVDEATRLS